MEAFGKFAAWALGVTLSTMWRGYVLSILWAWYMVALFQLPALRIPAAIGVAIVIGALTPGSPRKSEDYPSTTDVMIHAFLGPTIALLMGWIVKQWM